MPRDPVAQLLAAYPVLHHALKQRRLKVGAVGSVSAHQATILAQLSGGGGEGRTLTDLATAMEVSLPTMSLLVERLVRAGLIRRDRDPLDGRRVALRLTDAGGRAVRGRSLLDPERVRALFASLPIADRSAALAGFLTLARAARKLRAESTVETPNPKGRP